MTHRSFTRALATTLAALGLTLLTAALTVRIARAEVLKIGTLVPKSSPWGQVLAVWEKAVKEKSGGKLELQFFYNGSQGDEAAMVAKIKSGQLDGVMVSGVGLGKVHKPILALQMPGLFSSWAKLDAARDAMKGELEKGALDAGFKILGWGDVGAVRLLSKGFALRVGADFAGKKPFQWRDDSIQGVIFQVIGGVTGVPLNVPEVLPSLNTGAVNALFAPALVAEQLQWASKFDNLNPHVHSYSIGAVVIASKRLDALPADLRAIVLDTGKVAATALTKRIRSEDDAAFGRLKAKLTAVELTAEEKARWDELYKQVRVRLGKGTFDPALIKKLEDLAK